MHSIKNRLHKKNDFVALVIEGVDVADASDSSGMG
jgi:hypothetical protein